MQMVGRNGHGPEETGSFNNGDGERLNTLETFHQRLTGIEECCVDILGHLPNLERQATETEKQWAAIRELRTFFVDLHKQLGALTTAVNGLAARLDKRHPGAEP